MPAAAPNPAVPALPDPKTAHDTLFGEVLASAFFSRCAQRGRQPASEKQAQDLLDMAGKLRQASEDPRVKAAQEKAGTDTVTRASNALDSVLARYGLDGGIKTASAQAATVARKQAAMQLAGDPNIYNAVLSLKAAEASQLAAKMGLGQ